MKRGGDVEQGLQDGAVGQPATCFYPVSSFNSSGYASTCISRRELLVYLNALAHYLDPGWAGL